MACNKCKKNPAIDCGCKSITAKCGSCDNAQGCDKKECSCNSTKKTGCKTIVPTSCVKYNGIPLGYIGALAGDDLNKILGSIDDLIGKALNNKIDNISELITEALESNADVKTAIQDCVKGFIEDNPDVIGESIVGFINDGDTTILTALLTSLSDLLEEGNSTIENLFGSVIQNFFTDNPEAISDLFNIFLEEIRNGNVDVINVFSEIIEEIFNNNDELLQTFIENLTEVINNNEDVEQAFTDLITNLFNENPDIVCNAVANCNLGGGTGGNGSFTIVPSSSIETSVCNRTQSIVLSGTPNSTENIVFNKIGNGVVVITLGGASTTLNTNSTGTVTVTLPTSGEILGTINLTDNPSSVLSSTEVYYVTEGGNEVLLTNLYCIDLDCGSSGSILDADFTFQTPVVQGQSTTFTDTSIEGSGDIVTWAWTTSDGQTSNIENPDFTWNTAGTYTVTLTVTDDLGASDSETYTVVVGNTTTNPSPVPSIFFTANQNATREEYNLLDSDDDVREVTSSATNLPVSDTGTRILQIKPSLGSAWFDCEINNAVVSSSTYDFQTLSNLYASQAGSAFADGITYELRTCSDDGVNSIVYSQTIEIEVMSVAVQPFTIRASTVLEGDCASCRSLTITNRTGANITIEFIKTGPAGYGSITEFQHFESNCYEVGDIMPLADSTFTQSDDTTQRYTYGMIRTVTAGTTTITAVVRDSSNAVIGQYNVDRVSREIAPC